ncbi:ECF RNA polymerase sigma factor SigK [Agromyces salentinus]|uniref:ECF RNA polymerase sigma factor SigK n=2 Tax=Agromyces salentinus TaxID=269421 RepID=A0ABN2MMD9_9MICO
MTHALLSRPAPSRKGRPGGHASVMLGCVVDVAEQPGGHARALEDLLLATAAGDRDAFSLLYDATAARVFGLVRRLLVDAAQAEEVTQDVFLEAWQTAARFDPERGAAIPWLLTLAHRRAVDRVRASQSSRDRDLKVGIRDLDVPVDDVAEAAEIAIEHERVAEALTSLPAAQRECISLAYYGGCTQSEIATRLDVPLGTVKTRLRDGMIRLRDLLGVTT